MSEILEKVVEITKKNINQSVVNYLKSRGINKQSALQWEIGYLCSEKVLLNLNQTEDLEKTGLLIKKIHKSPLSQYLTFPMRNQYNQIIAISGRPPISNEQVKQRGLKKYWHTRFNKREFLFGLNFAIESARELGYIIVAEGQFDTIIAHQNQITNIVSTCGVALTEEHIIILSRYVDKIYVVFDNDEAGQKATEQINKREKSETKIIPIFLPDSTEKDGRKNMKVKEDPDSYIRKYGREKFLQVLGETK